MAVTPRDRARPALGLRSPLALLLIGLSGVANATAPEPSDPPPFVYAGFAFCGDFANRESLYPLSAELAAQDSGQFLDVKLRDKLKQRPELSSRMVTGSADPRQVSTAVAFALVQETTETQRIEGKYWAIGLLQANVLAFDPESGSLVASYPLRMRMAHALDHPPARADFRTMIESAYTALDPHTNIFDQWVTRLATLRLRNGATRYLRVTDVSLTPEAEAVIRSAAHSPEAIRNQVANFLEGAIAEGAGVPLVPNSLGEAIGAKIPFRFADGREYQLTLHPADFAISFVIRDFVSKELDATQSLQDIYRVKATVAVKQPDSGRVLVDENIYDTLIVTRPKRAAIELDLWDQYMKTLRGLINSVGVNFNSPDPGWLREHAARALEAKPGFQSVAQLMSELR